MTDNLQKPAVVTDLRKGDLPPANLDLPMPSGAAVPTAPNSQSGGGTQSGNQSGGQSNGNSRQS